MDQKRRQAFAPSRAAASYRPAGMDCRPLWRTTRLKGTPIQMFAMITEASDQDGEVSQFTGPTPIAWRVALTIPESELSIHDQVDADTISGSSHGTRNRARRVADRWKCWLKNTASPSPIAYWKT